MEWKISTTPVDYEVATHFMENHVALIASGEMSELIWLLEHNHLYSGGTSAVESEVTKEVNIPIYKTGRGGRYTYHGPGQKIIYAMLDLKARYSTPDIKKYIKDLEEWMILSLDFIGIKGELRSDRIGIWVNIGDEEKKIAAIGVRVRKWVSYHGIALNVNPDLTFYDNIVPCGIKDYGVTSIAELGINITQEAMNEILIENFKKIF